MCSSSSTKGKEEKKRALLDIGGEQNVNVTSDVGQDEVVCFF